MGGKLDENTQTEIKIYYRWMKQADGGKGTCT